MAVADWRSGFECLSSSLTALATVVPEAMSVFLKTVSALPCSDLFLASHGWSWLVIAGHGWS